MHRNFATFQCVSFLNCHASYVSNVLKDWHHAFVLVNYGIITLSVSGTSLQWRVPFALQMIPGVFLLVGLATQLESPRWLVEKGKIDAARVTLTRVHRKPANDPSIYRELEEIIADFAVLENLSLFLQLKAPCANRKIFYQVSYAPQIFKSIRIQGQNSGLFATGIYGVVKVFITSLGLMLATEQIGRKYSLMVGSAGQAFLCSILASKEQWHRPSPDVL